VSRYGIVFRKRRLWSRKKQLTNFLGRKAKEEDRNEGEGEKLKAGWMVRKQEHT